MPENNWLYSEKSNRAIRVAYCGVFYPLIQKIGVVVAFYHYERFKTIKCWIDNVSGACEHSFVEDCLSDGLFDHDVRKHVEILLKSKTIMQHRILMCNRIEKTPYSLKSFKRNACYCDIRKLIWNTLYPDNKL